MPKKHRKHLTALQVQRLIEEAQAGDRSREDLAKRYGISTSTVYAHLRNAGLGRTPKLPSKGLNGHNGHNGHASDRQRLSDLNEDILAGLPEDELRKRHDLVRNGRARSVDVAELVPLPELTPEQIQRVVQLLGRLGEKHPKVFSELRIMQRLTRYPMQLLEVL